MTVTLLTGDLGGGKTLLMTAILKDYKEILKKKVYANYDLSFGEPIKLTQLFKLELKNCAVGIDEAYVLLESRQSTTNIINQLSSYFFFQSRKRDVDIYMTAQIGGTIDVRVRLISHYIIYCEQHKKGFSYSIFNKAGELLSEFDLNMKKAKPIFELYDTKQIITPMYFDSQVNFKEVKEIFETAPTKRSFVTLIKKINPQLSYDDVSSCYDFLKIKKEKLAKQVLAIRI